MIEAKNKALGYALAATTLIACPCHLPLTLPVVAGVLGGTAFGAALTAHTGLLVAAATLYFVVALGAALYLLGPLARRKTESSKEGVKK